MATREEAVQLAREVASDQVSVNAAKDPNYAPYCMRCSGLRRMAKVEEHRWRCERCLTERDDRIAHALLALDERVRVLEQENGELRHAVIAVADCHESRRSIVREIAAYRSVANNLSKPFSIADVARRCEALATGEGKEG